MKPDRLARKVEQVEMFAYTFHRESYVIHRHRVLKLLRAEGQYQRARVRKIVDKVKHEQPNEMLWLMACDAILAALRGRP